MGFLKWLMKGVDVEENKLEIESELPVSVEKMPPTNVGMEALSHIADLEKSRTVPFESALGQNQMQNQIQNQMQNPAMQQSITNPSWGNPAANGVPPMGFMNANMNGGNLGYGATGQPFAQPMQSVGANQFMVFKIFSKEEIKLAISELSRGKSCTLHFQKMGRKPRGEIMLFLSGAVFALNATLSHLNDEVYLLTPRGVKPNFQSKTKRIK